MDWAADEAVRHDVPLHLLQVVAPQHEAPELIAAAAERATKVAPAVRLSSEVLPEDAASALLGRGRNAFALVLVHVFRDVIEGPAHKVLGDASGNADMLVVGAMRRHGHFGPRLGRVNGRPRPAASLRVPGGRHPAASPTPAPAAFLHIS